MADGNPGPPMEPFEEENNKRVPKLPKEFLWDDKPRKLKDFIANCRLPFVAKLESGDLSEHCQTWKSVNNADGDDVILHFLEIKKSKAVAVRKMQWNRKTNNYVACGRQVDIPVSFKGWFEVLPEDGRPVEYFDSIQAITNVKPRQFLVRTSTVGYQLSVDNGANTWMPYEIRPGTVLTTGIVFMDQKKSKGTVRHFFRKLLKPSKGSKRDQDLKYLQCFDNTGVEVMIPLVMSGVFSPVGGTAEESFDSVYKLQDLILAFNLPVQVQLVHEEEEQECQHLVPHGTVRLEEVKDEEVIMFGRYPINEDNEELFQVPIHSEVIIRKDISKRKKSRRKSEVNEKSEKPPSVTEENVYANTEQKELALPLRVKDTKKNKTGIFDKLSVRSRSRKERASLKAMQENGVFSGRLSKSEVNIEDVCVTTGDDINSVNAENHEKQRDKGDVPQPKQYIEDKGMLVFTDLNPNCNIISKLNTPKDRDLPPIPNPESPKGSISNDKEGVYEELPVAPEPPDTSTDVLCHGGSSEERQDKYKVHHHEDDEEGYMSPNQIKMESSAFEDDVVRRKPPTGQKEVARVTRARKTKSEIPTNNDFFRSRENSNSELKRIIRNSMENLQRLNSVDSNFNQSSNTIVAASSPYEPSTFTYEDALGFVDDSHIDLQQNCFKQKSKSQRNLDASNVTVRSHNIRRMRHAAEVFSFADSLQDLRESAQQMQGVTLPGQQFDSKHTSLYGRASMYCESEPGFYRKGGRSASVTGISENLNFTYKGQGDDSAISGDYGYHGDSEYSYNEYADYRDDSWVPPDDLSHLTVEEVSKSLHYIGMKDRVVIRLANEQIDGKLLCSLDKELLKEGFPELNALDIKKIVDFINGWRPKKKR